MNTEPRVERSNRVGEWINMTTQSYKGNCTSMLIPAKNDKLQLTMQFAIQKLSEMTLFPTPGGAGVWVVVRLWRGVWLRRVGGQSGGSEDVLAGPAFGGCVHMIVCEEMDQVRREKRNRQNQSNRRNHLGGFWDKCLFAFSQRVRWEHINLKSIHWIISYDQKLVSLA